MQITQTETWFPLHKRTRSYTAFMTRLGRDLERSMIRGGIHGIKILGLSGTAADQGLALRLSCNSDILIYHN